MFSWFVLAAGVRNCATAHTSNHFVEGSLQRVFMLVVSDQRCAEFSVPNIPVAQSGLFNFLLERSSWFEFMSMHVGFGTKYV